MYNKQNKINQEKNEPKYSDAIYQSFGCQEVLPMCDESVLFKPGCFNVKNNDYTKDLYDVHTSLKKLEKIEYVLLVIIVVDLIIKLYNDKMVK